MTKRLAEEIRKLVVSTMKKEQLRDMAKRGEPRPKSPLAKALGKYAGGHDPAFAREIRALRPHWFGRRNDALETVVERLVNAQRNPGNPALKARATRALRAYATTRAKETGSTPEAVAAGARAAATKRMRKPKAA